MVEEKYIKLPHIDAKRWYLLVEYLKLRLCRQRLTCTFLRVLCPLVLWAAMLSQRCGEVTLFCTLTKRGEENKETNGDEEDEDYGGSCMTPRQRQGPQAASARATGSGLVQRINKNQPQWAITITS